MMKQQKFSARRRQVLTAGAIGTGALAAPGAVLAHHERTASFAAGKIVVSGRVTGINDGQALAGAQVEIWQANARGVRDERTREVVTTDGDGRYFAALKVESGNTQRLHYRVSHQGYTAKVTQLHAQAPAQASQSTVTLTRDHEGATRAAFALALAPRGTTVAAVPDYAAL